MCGTSIYTIENYQTGKLPLPIKYDSVDASLLMWWYVHNMLNEIKELKISLYTMIKLLLLYLNMTEKI
jgi:hypothetical protein